MINDTILGHGNIKAATPQRCDTCGSTINRGENFIYVWGVKEHTEQLYSANYCLPCNTLWTEYWSEVYYDANPCLEEFCSDLDENDPFYYEAQQFLKRIQ